LYGIHCKKNDTWSQSNYDKVVAFAQGEINRINQEYEEEKLVEKLNGNIKEATEKYNKLEKDSAFFAGDNEHLNDSITYLSVYHEDSVISLNNSLDAAGLDIELLGTTIDSCYRTMDSLKLVIINQQAEITRLEGIIKYLEPRVKNPYNGLLRYEPAPESGSKKANIVKWNTNDGLRAEKESDRLQKQLDELNARVGRLETIVENLRTGNTQLKSTINGMWTYFNDTTQTLMTELEYNIHEVIEPMLATADSSGQVIDSLMKIDGNQKAEIVRLTGIINYLRIQLGGDTATDEMIRLKSKEVRIYYDMSGKRVKNPVQGTIYIEINGNQRRKIVYSPSE
jgi:chromosome segregation ATPase